MGDVYKDVDFERMLSDLGAALERNKAPQGTMPAQPGADVPGIPTARFADVPQGAAPMSPQDAQTSAQLDAAAPGAVAFGGGHPASPPMSPQDMQTLAQLNQATPGAMQFGAGIAPHPAHAPPPAVAAQLAGVAQQPTAMSAPPTVYPNIDPNAAGGLAGYAALR